MAAQRKSGGAARKVKRARFAHVAAVPDARSSNFSSSAARFGARLGITKSRLIVLALAGLTLAVYGQVWRFEFITLDDPFYASANPHVRSGLTLGGIKWAFSKFYIANWFPLTWLSLMLDGTAYDAWAGGYHLTNLLFHLANVVLVFAVFTKATGKELLAGFVAALFAVHPLHAESVAWISERKDVLSVFFGLLCLSQYVNYAQRGRLRSYLLALTFLTLSLMSKQTLVTMPFVMLLLDYWPLKRLTRRAIVEKIPFLAISAVFCLVAIRAGQRFDRSLSRGRASGRVAWQTRRFPMSRICKRGLSPGIWGFITRFRWNLACLCWLSPSRVLVGLTAASLGLRRRYPYLTIGWLWFLGTMVPMIGFVQIGLQQMADRYAYFPFLGLYLALGGFLTSRRAAIAIVSVYGVFGFVQTGYWHDTLTLLNHTARVTGDNSFLCLALGDGLMAEGRLGEAMEQYRRRKLRLNEFAREHFRGNIFPKPTAPLSFRADDRVVGLGNGTRQRLLCSNPKRRQAARRKWRRCSSPQCEMWNRAGPLRFGTILTIAPPVRIRMSFVCRFSGNQRPRFRLAPKPSTEISRQFAHRGLASPYQGRHCHDSRIVCDVAGKRIGRHRTKLRQGASGQAAVLGPPEPTGRCLAERLSAAGGSHNGTAAASRRVAAGTQSLPPVWIDGAVGNFVMVPELLLSPSIGTDGRVAADAGPRGPSISARTR